MNQQQEVITPEIIDIQPRPVKGALAKTAWDSLPIAHRTSDNLQVIRDACNHSGAEFLSLCRREGLQPDFSVIVVNHTENHYHTTHQGVDASQIAAMIQQANASQIAAMIQQANASQIEALRAQQAAQPAYYPHQCIDYQPTSYQPPAVNLYIEGPEYYNDVHPTVSASSHATSESHSEGGYGGGWPLWFGVAWLVAILLAVATASGD